MGAPPGNANAVKHGLTCRDPLRFDLILGELGDSLKLVVRHTNALRRQIEDAVLAAKGQIDILDAATIQTACRWERVSQLAHRWIEEGVGEMTQSERLHFAQTIARASTERDKCLKALRLDASDATTIDALYDVAPLADSESDDDSEQATTAADDGATDDAEAVAPLERVPVSEPTEKCRFSEPSSQVIASKATIERV